MAYSKTTWADGDLITAAKLNKMETGIEAGQDVFWVNCTAFPNSTVTGENETSINYIADKTAEDVYNAAVAGKIVLYRIDKSSVEQRYAIFPLNQYEYDESGNVYRASAYMVVFGESGPLHYQLEQRKDEDDYLVITERNLSPVEQPT